MALLLQIQGVADLSLATELDEISVKADLEESIEKERSIQIKDSIGDEEDLQEPSYSPTRSCQALANPAAYPCEKCGKHFRNQIILEAHSKSHLKVEEGKNQTFECSTCSKTVSNKYILATHMKSHNNGPGRIERALCNVCSKSFANKYILKAHMQIHSEETKATEVFSCNVCQKSFHNKYILKYHMKSHSEDAQEKETALCNLCSKLMAKATLKKHMRHIHGESKFTQCSNCAKNFRMSCIESHERRCKRSDEERLARKVKCGQCGNTLSGKATLRKHIRNVHNNEQHPDKY